MTDYIGNVQLRAAGEQGLVVEFGNEISSVVNVLVKRLVEVLAQAHLDGIMEIIPTYRSVMICFDPIVLTRLQLSDTIANILEQVSAKCANQIPRRVICVPVCYGGVFGSDMDFVIRRTGLSMEEIIQIHTSKPYLVYMLGFTPGFPYLGGLSKKLFVPRLSKSRAKIPEGSVGIAGEQTGFYTVQSTGEWRIIGRTPLKAFNPENTDPFLVAIGDYVQFKVVSVDDFFAIRREVEAGTYVPDITTLAGD